MWKVRCKVSVSLFLCAHTIHVHTASMHALGSDMFACVRLQSIFGCRSWGGWTWGSGCLAGWRSDMMQCRVSECCWPLVLLRHGYYSGTLTRDVSRTWCARFVFIHQTEESNLSRADNNGKHSLVELSCCGTQGGKVFRTFDKMTLFCFFAMTVFPLFSVFSLHFLEVEVSC